MYRKLSFFLSLAFVISAVSLITFQITYKETDEFWRSKITDMLASGKTETENNLSAVAEIVKSNSVKQTDEKTASEKVIEGYMSSLDRFSMYMNEDEYLKYISLQNSPSNVGIGVNTLYDSTLDGIFVVNVYKESAAEQAGIVPGDLITAVDGIAVKELGFYGAMYRITDGEEESDVSITLKKNGGQTVTKNIKRKEVKFERITGEKLDKKTGLITINGFASGDKDVFESVMGGLIEGGCEKFVLDVRNNSGGNIEEITRILDFLMPSGELFTVSDKSGAANRVLSDANSLPYPLAVLVNEGTVGGAEVFAAALKTAPNANLFGTATYGKATTQAVHRLEFGGAVSVSSSIYSVGGISFEDTGVVPDSVIEMSDEHKAQFTTLQKKDDAPLQAAIKYLATRSAALRD